MSRLVTRTAGNSNTAAAAAGLVERGGELAALAQAIDDLDRTGAFVLVEGPAGIGKTSLLHAAATMATEAGCRVLHARGMELERQFSFGLIRQLFELPLALATEQQRTEWLSGGAAAAAAVLGNTTQDQTIMGDFAVLNGLFWLTSNLCQHHPLALLVDDLHWADRGSLRFLTYLQPRLEDLPLIVIGAARQHEPGAEQHLLDLLETNQSGTLLYPEALTPTGTATIINQDFGKTAETAFLTACHTATGGNPLMLRALVRVATHEGITPTADNIKLLPKIGVDALGTRIETRMNQLPPTSAGLARAVALLGKDTPTELAATLSGLTTQQATEAAKQLTRIQILTPHNNTLDFVHPLVRTAIYQQIPADERIAGHNAAATLLTQQGADPERIATHLLRVPPTNNPQSIHILQQSADTAYRRGSSDAALAYLTRCLDEPLNHHTQLTIQHTAGQIALGVDLAIAERHLTTALHNATEPLLRAQIAYPLAHALYYLVRYEESRQLCLDALEWVPADDIDLRRRLQAILVSLGVACYRHPDLPGRVAELRELEPQPTVGARMLDAIIAAFDAFTNDPASVARAVRGMSDGLLVKHSNGDTAVLGGWWVLMVGEWDGIMAEMDAGVAQAHRTGSFYALTATLVWRGLGWLLRGELSEAISDERRGIEASETGQIQIAHLFAGPFLAEALIEQGDLDGAAEALRWVGAPDPLPPGTWYLYLHAKAQYLRQRGEYQKALAATLAAGERFASLGGTSPAFLSWRSEAALCLHALGRMEDARRYAEEELELARHWGASRCLGRALRVAGLISGQRSGLDLLTEAVDVLATSPAKLEHAKALVDLGAALRRSGRRADAKGRLSSGLELAERCGAEPLARHAETELRATGETIRHTTTSSGSGGTNALTPSEHRVAQLAANGHTNRDIAQQLFVTVKTVELHLGNTYRKLGVSGRDQLPALLGENG